MWMLKKCIVTNSFGQSHPSVDALKERRRQGPNQSHPSVDALKESRRQGL